MMKAIFKLAVIALSIIGLAVDASKTDLENGVCKYNTYMCCWTKNDNGVQDNTDVCSPPLSDRRQLASDSESEYSAYAGDAEGDTHCHGFVWANDADYDAAIFPLFNYVKKFDHKQNRGYYGKIKKSPKCACIEDMAVVSRADCTTFSNQGLVACVDNDLRTHYDTVMLKPAGELDVNLVGTCPNA